MSFAAVASKTGAVGARSLSAMAQQRLTEHVHEIVSFGDAPVHLIAPVLRRVTNPHQLHDLELESPQILALAPELWQALIRRDIPYWQARMPVPRDPSAWWKVYFRLKRDEDAARATAEEQLRGALGKAAAARKDNSALVLHTVLPEERNQTGYLDSGVKSKDLGRNVLADLKRAASTQHMVDATYTKLSPVQNRDSSSSQPLSRQLSKIQGAVRATSRGMLSQYAGRGTAPTSGPSRFTPSANNRVAKPGKATKNPFRPNARSNMSDVHQRALDLAVDLEKKQNAVRLREDQKKVDKLTAARGLADSASTSRSPPPAASSSRPRAATGSTSGPAGMGKGKAAVWQHVVDVAEGHAAVVVTTKRKASPVASPARVEAPVKKKAPSIFLAPRKVAKR